MRLYPLALVPVPAGRRRGAAATEYNTRARAYNDRLGEFSTVRDYTAARRAALNATPQGAQLLCFEEACDARRHALAARVREADRLRRQLAGWHAEFARTGELRAGLFEASHEADNSMLDAHAMFKKALECAFEHIRSTHLTAAVRMLDNKPPLGPLAERELVRMREYAMEIGAQVMPSTGSDLTRRTRLLGARARLVLSR